MHIINYHAIGARARNSIGLQCKGGALDSRALWADGSITRSAERIRCQTRDRSDTCGDVAYLGEDQSLPRASSRRRGHMPWWRGACRPAVVLGIVARTHSSSVSCALAKSAASRRHLHSQLSALMSTWYLEIKHTLSERSTRTATRNGATAIPHPYRRASASATPVAGVSCTASSSESALHSV